MLAGYHCTCVMNIYPSVTTIKKAGWSRVGDGDCGTTLAQGARAIVLACRTKYPLNDAAATMSAVAETVGRSMGGSSGALYQIFFVALAGPGCRNSVLGPVDIRPLLSCGLLTTRERSPLAKAPLVD